MLFGNYNDIREFALDSSSNNTTYFGKVTDIGEIAGFILPECIARVVSFSVIDYIGDEALLKPGLRVGEKKLSFSEITTRRWCWSSLKRDVLVYASFFLKF